MILCRLLKFDAPLSIQAALLLAQTNPGERGADDFQRQFQPVRFLGIDGELQVAGFGQAGERDETRRELRQHPLARDRFKARMQRRELHRNSRARRQRRNAGARADRFDRRRIGIEIFLGIRRIARAFAEHVERVAEFGVAAGARERFVDGLAEHEMRADEPHGLARRRAQCRKPEPPHDIVKDRLRRLARMDDAGGNAERPRRGGDEQRLGSDIAVEPAAGGELVFDQAVGGHGVGHAQQRLGEHHERQPFFGRQRIGVQKILDAAEPACLGADRLDQRACAGVDAAFGGMIARRRGEEARGHVLVGRRERCAELQQA